jgi:chromosome segregation ATPase
MSTDITDEHELKADIDKLRASFPKTQDLYREVCALMFFRYGIAPTANKLYQLVRKGSMSTPAEALTRFWEDLREKSRVRIEHPDLPNNLKEAAAEMTMALWASAQSLAQESLATFKADAQAAIAQAQAQRTTAESECNAARSSLAQSQQTLHDALVRMSELEQSLAAANATNVLLESQLQQARIDQESREQKLEDARRAFSVDLEKMREATKMTEARYQAAEKRALLDIDRERTHAAKLQKELTMIRASLDETSQRHGTEVAALQHQIGELRQNAGVLEGKLQSLTTSSLKLERDYNESLNQLVGLRDKLLKSENESQEWKNHAHEYLRRLNELQRAAKPKRSKRPLAHHS